jgi:hypothetical protein
MAEDMAPMVDLLPRNCNGLSSNQTKVKRVAEVQRFITSTHLAK